MIEPLAQAPVRILVVDDDVVDRLTVRRALASCAFASETVEAEHASAALDLLARERFDLVLCDLRMPGPDGRFVIEEVRKRDLPVPVIVLTGHGDEETAVELLKLGAADYISKASLHRERLEQGILAVLKLARAEREARTAQLALRRRAEQLRAMTELAPELHASLAPDAIVRLLAERAVSLLGASLVVVRLAEEDRELSCAFGREGEIATPEPRSPMPRLERVVRATRDALERDASLRMRAAATGLGLPSRGWLAAPLTTREGASIGVVHATDKADGDFDESDEALVAQLAHLASVALSNARLVAQARAAARAREETLAVVSHDLRNPLAVVRLALHPAITLEGEVRDRARRAVDRMEQLIRDLLDIARIDGGKLAVDTKPHSPVDLVSETVELMRPLARSRGVDIRVALAESLPLVRVDRPRIAQVFQNLLGNAIRFTKGDIEVSAEATLGAVRFAVSDRGPGIPSDALHHIFDRFWRPNDAPRDGAGLGLAIAKGIVEAHRGTIWAYNRPEGGATFFFTVPTSDENESAAA